MGSRNRPAYDLHISESNNMVAVMSVLIEKGVCTYSELAEVVVGVQPYVDRAWAEIIAERDAEDEIDI
jgi:hypothetical protein